MKHSQEFQFFIFYSREDIVSKYRFIQILLIFQTNENLWQEIYAGSERPALRLTDDWKWIAPKTGEGYMMY